MCEPHHSIVQFPDKDDNDTGRPGGGLLIDSIPAPEGSESVWDKWKKKIENWFHFSFMGFGHSESLGRLTPLARRMLPDDTKYEANWWDRSVHLDGMYYGLKMDEKDALNAATRYAEKVSIGNLTLLRQFLEVSMRKSDRPGGYVHQFPQMLVAKGRDLFNEKMKRLGVQIDYYRRNEHLETIIKIMMGFTRKRGLLVPEWADDTKLWTPSIVTG